MEKSIHKKTKEVKKKQRVSSRTQLSRNSVSSNWLEFLKLDTVQERKIFVKKITSMGTKNVPKKHTSKITKVLAMDCEMVSNLKDENMLARVSLVNFNLECVYDKFVKPTEQVGDYRTKVSGIRPENIINGEDISVIQQEVKQLLQDKILVGHALHNDFRVLGFYHHWKFTRDTAKYKPFHEGCGGKTPSLKKLAHVYLNEKIQEGEHSSVEDAKAAMKLYLKHRFEWEKSIISYQQKKGGRGPQTQKKSVDELVLPES